MRMNGNVIGTIIVLIIVIVGGWFLLSGNQASAPSTITTDEAAVTSTTINVPPTPPTTIVYSDQGFSPASITVTVGTIVTFVNQSSDDMWVASAMHPTHTVYSGTSLSQHCPDTDNSTFDECKGDVSGSSFSFTFTKEGTWKYHDHLNPTRFGTIIVTAEPTTTSI